MILLLTTLLACKEDAKPQFKDIPDDTATDTGEDTVVECTEGLDTNPSIDLPTSSWFYRDAVRLTFSEANPALSVTATDSSGSEIAVRYTWNDSREYAEILPESGAWAGNEDYTLNIEYCQHSASLSFGTSSYGLPLETSNADLINKTYNIDLTIANYTDPPGIGTLLGQNIDQPLLFGIEAATDSSLDFIAALGMVDDFGTVTQTTGLWSFPNADFSAAPFFDAYSEFLQIEYGSIGIPIHQFKISGTFSADGNKIGRAHFEGWGDTRELGPALSAGMGEDAICSMLENLGSGCEVCPGDDSGNAFCAFLAGDIEEVSIIPNLILEDM